MFSGCSVGEVPRVDVFLMYLFEAIEREPEEFPGDFSVYISK